MANLDHVIDYVVIKIDFFEKKSIIIDYNPLFLSMKSIIFAKIIHYNQLINYFESGGGGGGV